MPDVEPIGIGVLGAADIAWRRTVPAIERCARLRLVAVASRSREKARRFADRFGGDAVTGYQRLLDREDVAAVYIAVPNALHAEWTEAAVRAGKHVLVEKSLTASVATAAALVKSAEAAGLALLENFAFLTHTQHERVRELVAAGAIGTPQVVSASFGIPPADPALIRYSRELAGGALRETGCYTVRVAQLFLAEDVAVLGARLRYDPRSGVDVSGSALLADGAGVTAQCDFGLNHAYRNTYAIWGSEGRLEVDRAFTLPPDTRPVLRLQHADVREERLLPVDDQFLGVVTSFARACADPAAREEHGLAIVRQAGLLESIVRQADAAGPAVPIGSGGQP